MATNSLTWMALVAGAVGTGASFASILVARRSWEGIIGLAGFLSFVICAWGFGGVTLTYDRMDASVYAFLFAAAGIAGGYALVSTLSGWMAKRAKDGSSHIPSSLPDNPGTVAVLVLGEVEPPSYSPTATAAALEDLAEEGLLKASIGVLPFLFMSQKTRYRAAGGTSPAARQLDSVTERVRDLLSGCKSVGRLESAWCEGERSLASRVASEVAKGFRSIVVAEAVIAESLEIDTAKRAVDALRLGDIGVTVTYSGPLWGSERIAHLVTERILRVVGDAAAAGVVLVGQGQPEDRARERRDFDNQETAFLNRVRMLLLEQSLTDQNVRIAWAEWRAPEVTSTVRHLAALGCRRIIVSPACFPFDSIATVLDLQLAVRQSRVEDGVSVVTLPAWHDDPGFAEELQSDISGALGPASERATEGYAQSPC
jgi:protoheme ferro-lyase